MKHKHTPETEPEILSAENNVSLPEAADTNALAGNDPDLEEVSLAPAKKRPKKKGRKVIIIAALLVVIIIAAAVVRNASAASKGLSVSVAEAALGSVEETISTSGFVKSSVSKTYFAPVNTTIQECNFKVGDTVTAGEQLVSFDTSDLEVSAQKAALTATSTSADYNHNLSENSENRTDYEIASANVELYKLLIVAQRAYINDINYAIANKTYDVSQSAQCVRDSLQKKMNTKSEEAASVKKEVNSLSQNAVTDPNDPDHQRYIDLQNNLTDISTEESKLSGAMSSTSSLVNTADENKQLAEAQNMLTDMQSYLAKDESKMEAAKKAILDANQKEKLKADSEITQLSAAQAADELTIAQAGIRSDFDGIVTEATAASGALAAKGSSLLVVESTQDVYVDVTVTKYNLDKISIGQIADITIAGKSYTGSITKINKKAQNNSQGTPVITAQVRIDNPDDTIFLGVEAKVIIHVAKADDVLLVPVETVNTDNSGSFCYIVKDGIVTRCNVSYGVTSDTFVEITSGLKEGDLLINDYTLPIEEGMQVSPILPLEDAAEPDTGDADTGEVPESSDSDEAQTDTSDTDSTDASVTAGAALE
ncbi:MAG: efflux RND transporter periplasmic adaptor subunit [Lachnospiraceae bacterium]